MPKVGDRVIFPGLKVGGASRAGKLTEVNGAAVRVRWDDGSTTFLVPGPGAMQIENGGSAKKPTPAAKKPVAAAKKSVAAAKKPVAAAKKLVAKKPPANKPAVKKKR